MGNQKQIFKEPQFAPFLTSRSNIDLKDNCCNAIVVSGEDATPVTTMIHQPDPSVAVGGSSQNDEDAKIPLRSDYELIASEGSSEESDANSQNYELPMVAIIYNNGGVYSGDRRIPEEINGPHKDDPTPTSFVSKAGYHALVETFGRKDYHIGTPNELKSALYC
ncbi:2-hydroxyacyl-CoA lyase [Arachis hypogaea]|nr:2-hydroxyacyl-CoA lyase [Arachis hypogaea]